MNASKSQKTAFYTQPPSDLTAHDASYPERTFPVDAPETSAQLDPPEGHHMPIARVAAVDRDQYIIRNTEGELPAELTGKFAYTRNTSIELPCVGDWVHVQYHDQASRASIHNVLPRKTFLRRKRPGKNVAFQMMAANIDTAFIVQSCHVDFNVSRLERYLVMVREGHIEPVIVLTKADLITAETLEEQVEQIRRAGIDARIIVLSHVTGTGIDEIQALVQKGKTYCLLGSSGVGKSTLINRLLGHAALETGAVSHTGEGRHTTTRRQLVELAQGGLLIDMPGMRELGMLDVTQGINEQFADIQTHAAHCRFANCTHTTEPGCAVLSAMAQGELDAGQFQDYLKLKKESEFHDMSYHERRKKDRTFGKHVRAVLKTKDKRRND